MEARNKKYPLIPLIKIRKNKNFIPFLNSSTKFLNLKKIIEKYVAQLVFMRIECIITTFCHILYELNI